MTSGDTIVKRSCSLLLYWIFELLACCVLRLYINFPPLKLVISGFCCSGEVQTLFVLYVSATIPQETSVRLLLLKYIWMVVFSKSRLSGTGVCFYSCI